MVVSYISNTQTSTVFSNILKNVLKYKYIFLVNKNFTKQS